MRYEEKAHCLSLFASYVLFLHDFSGQIKALVFLNSEAVSTPGVFDTRLLIYIYLRVE